MRESKDYLNKKVDSLTVIGMKDGFQNAKIWLCQCDCGQKFEAKTYELNSRSVKSCGCKKVKKYLELGEKFSMLTVEEITEGYKGRTAYLCRCDCGESIILQRNSLTTGATKSCGCLQHKGTHGMSLSVEYRTWASMKGRCLNENDQAYKYYGGRGVKVYEKWIKSFKEFYDYIGPKPGPEYSIERINCDGNYEPGNVKWATVDEQWENRKRRSLSMSTFQEAARKNKCKDELENTPEQLADLLVQISQNCDRLGISLQSVAMLAMPDRRRLEKDFI